VLPGARAPGPPLDPAAQKKETERLNNLLRNSAEQARMKQDHEAEEQRVQRLIAAMPEAFLYTYDGMADGNLRLSFRPNPAYNPQTYEARVYHALAGEIWIQPQLKRLVKIDAHIVRDRLRLRPAGPHREGGQLSDRPRAGRRKPLEDQPAGRAHLGAHCLLQIHQQGSARAALELPAGTSDTSVQGRSPS
jgi:hypothetical protein